MTALARKLGTVPAISLSISIMAPRAAMAVNVSLTAQAAGSAAPLAFGIGTAVMGIVGRSFVAYSRRIVHAGSVYAYVSHTFGVAAGLLSVGHCCSPTCRRPAVLAPSSGVFYRPQRGTLACIWPCYGSSSGLRRSSPRLTVLIETCALQHA